MTDTKRIADGDLTDPDAIRARIRALQAAAAKQRAYAGVGCDRNYFDARAQDLAFAAHLEASAAALFARLQAMGESLDAPDDNPPEQPK
jgi:hypothetical protein